MNSKFPLGSLVATAAVADLMERDADFSAFVHVSLGRHAAGDWGDMDAEDKLLNEDSLVSDPPGRLMSVYISRSGKKIWIITEQDRSATTVLFPEDY